MGKLSIRDRYGRVAIGAEECLRLVAEGMDPKEAGITALNAKRAQLPLGTSANDIIACAAQILRES